MRLWSYRRMREHRAPAAGRPTQNARGAVCLSSERKRGMRIPSSGHEFYPDKEQDDRTDDRHDEPGRMKRRTWLRFGKQSADQSADDRPSDPKQRGHYETEMLRTRHDGTCDQTDDETDNDVRNDV